MKLPLLFVLLTSLSLACSNKKPQAPPPPQQLKVVEVESRNVPISNDFVGQVYGYFDIPIRARVEGYLESVDFREGSTVDKGQLLYTIDSQPFQENVAARKSELAQAEIAAVNAESHLNRIRPLAEINAVSKRDLDDAVAAYKAANAQVEAARANVRMAEINMGYTHIHSPIRGTIGKTLAKAGEFVGRQPNPVILNTVSRIDSVHVQFHLTESNYLRIARTAIANRQVSADRVPDKISENISIQLVLSDGLVYGERGRLDFINREVDPSTGSILVQTTFPNPNRLIKPGQFAKVRITFQEENGLVIPQKCVSELQGNHFVYVIDDENKVVRKPIQTNAEYVDLYLVRSGLQIGEKVLIEGIQRVREGMTISPELVAFDSQIDK